MANKHRQLALNLPSFLLEFIIGFGRSSNNASICSLSALNKSNAQQPWPFDSFVGFQQLRGEISASLAEKITKEMKKERKTACLVLRRKEGATGLRMKLLKFISAQYREGGFGFEFFIKTKSNVFFFPLAKNNNAPSSQIQSH